MTLPTATERSDDVVAARPARLARLLAFLLPAMAGMFAVFQSVQLILIPAQVAHIDPAHKVGNLALLTTFVGIASMVAIPLGGSLSDRTRSRFGRRTPWIAILSVVAGVLMIGMGLTDNLALLAVVYVAAWLAMSAYQGAINAILPDRVPVERRGFASAIIGLGAPLGTLLGVNIASRVGQAWGYTVIAAVLVLTALLLVTGTREASSLDAPGHAPRVRTGFSVAATRSYFEAFANRDFTMAFISRLFVFLSYFTVSGYLYYTLTDYVGADKVPGGDVAVAVGTLSSINVVAWIIVATICGWLADRINRRKLFVAIAAVGLGLSMFIPIISPTWTGMLLYSIFSGMFIGTYFAVDLALMSLVLPFKEREGRDFGLLAVAAGIPTICSSLIAGGLITFLGGYTALYIFGAIAAVIAGVVTFGIKSVR